jgi:peptide/nickel transport system substrate-binding protein
MNSRARYIQLMIGVVVVLTMVLSGCSTPATPATPAAAPAVEPTQAAEQPTQAPAPTAEPTKAAEQPTEAPAATGATTTTEASAAPAAGAGLDQATLDKYFNAPREQTLIIDQPYRLEGSDNWNPYVPNNAAGWGWTNIGTDPLVLLSYGTGETENWMAESFEANKTFDEWTLKLRQGITWSDGVPFTADDVVFSTQLQQKYDTLGQHYYYEEWLKSVDKVDDLTVKFTLKKPNVRFTLECYGDMLCGNHTFVPKHVWEKVSDPTTYKFFDIKNDLPMGTGPYVLYKVTDNETIWVRNDNWWAAKTGLKKLPEPLKVIFSYAGTEEVRTATAIDNGFDSLQDITLSSYQALTAQNQNWIPFQKDAPYVWPDPCARTLSLNDSVKPWDDKDMRWVLAEVMDRQQIIDVAYEGSTIPGAYYWPLYPSMQKYTDLVPQDALAKLAKPDTAAAEKVLLAKGYTKGAQYWEKDGKPLSLEIQVNEAFSELERIADVYVEQLQRFGINGTKVKLTANTFYDDFAFGKFEAQSGWQTCGSIVEPWSTLKTLANDPAPIGERPTNNQNSYRWFNKQYTDLVNEMGTLALDDPKLMADTKEALQILYDEMPVIPTAQSRKLIPFNTTYWTNWPTKDNYYQRPVNWCPSFIGVITQIKAVTK